MKDKGKGGAGSAPKYLSNIAQYYYRKLVGILKERGIYDPVDNAALEMLASLYGEYRDEASTPKDKREAIKLFIALIKEYGGTIASRQRLELELEKEEDRDKDLLEFMAN